MYGVVRLLSLFLTKTMKAIIPVTKTGRSRWNPDRPDAFNKWIEKIHKHVKNKKL